MPPTSDGVRTVGCSLKKLIPDAGNLDAIEKAVLSTHKATFLATELLNMHMRRVLALPDYDMSVFFNSNWLCKAYNEVTVGKRKVKRDEALKETFDRCMPPFSPPDRTGILQCIGYECINLATVAGNNVWMHFKKRVLAHVRTAFFLGKEEHAKLSKDEKKRRKLEVMQMAADICRMPTETRQSPSSRHQYVEDERRRLGIDEAVGEWKNKPILYHLKTRPHRFLRAMALMSKEREDKGGRAFSLFPLRRSHVPRHVRFDQKVLRSLCGLGESDYMKEREKKRRKMDKEKAENDKSIPPLQPDGTGYDSGGEAGTSKRQRRTKDEMEGEKAELFASIVDLRAAKVARRSRFDFAFTTDGVCARLQMRTNSKAGGGKKGELASIPKRGEWSIDQLKRVSRLDQIHLVGVDPGKRELVVGVDMDDTNNPKKRKVVRYTQKQRLRDQRSRQYADEAKRGKPQSVKDAEEKLSGFNSRTSDLEQFRAYCEQRHESMEACLAFYSDHKHRRRRWKTAIKTQQSEERLYKRLEALKKEGDERPLVLAYGSWGMVAGRPGVACNRGNSPCIGVGLMRKLSRRFVVALTPEAYTSKTCCCCLGPCVPWEEKEKEMGRTIRGLRRCTQRGCMLPLNRDKNGATNIGTNFMRLFEGKPPIRSMSDEDLTLHRASLCLECE